MLQLPLLYPHSRKDEKGREERQRECTFPLSQPLGRVVLEALPETFAFISLVTPAATESGKCAFLPCSFHPQQNRCYLTKEEAKNE